MTFEVSGEMRLIVEADARRNLRDGLAVEQAPSRGVDATRQQVAVRSDRERASEAPHEVRR
jgi:hypothetical protein